MTNGQSIDRMWEAPQPNAGEVSVFGPDDPIRRQALVNIAFVLQTHIDSRLASGLDANNSVDHAASTPSDSQQHQGPVSSELHRDHYVIVNSQGEHRIDFTDAGYSINGVEYKSDPRRPDNLTEIRNRNLLRILLDNVGTEMTRHSIYTAGFDPDLSKEASIDPIKTAMKKLQQRTDKIGLIKTGQIEKTRQITYCIPSEKQLSVPAPTQVDLEIFQTCVDRGISEGKLLDLATSGAQMDIPVDALKKRLKKVNDWFESQGFAPPYTVDERMSRFTFAYTHLASTDFMPKPDK